jgi:hypothetical protein
MAGLRSPQQAQDPAEVTIHLPYVVDCEKGVRARVAAMTKWEYATVPLLVHATKQILDTWGEDGWELVQVVPGPGGGEQVVAYLKRAK